MNRNFIASTLCEKKEQPGNHCKGNCQLKKHLAKDNERQEKNNQNVKGSIEVLFSEIKNETTFRFFVFETVEYFKFRSSPLIKGHGMNVFHPPSC